MLAAMRPRFLSVLSGIFLLACVPGSGGAPSDADTDVLDASVDLPSPRPDLRGDMAPPGDMAPSDGGTGSLCDVAGWCWENPLPHGNPIHDVWGPAAGDVWAVGGAGTVLHFDGTTWSLVKSPTRKSLYGLWGASSNDVWAVGQGGVILHFDGTAWSSAMSPTQQALKGVWGSSSTSVWAAAATSESIDPWTRRHTFVHWDGTSWTPTFARAPEPANTNIAEVWGCSANEIYAVGTHGKASRFTWNGMSWMGAADGSSSSSDTGVWCSGAGRPWFARNSCPMGSCSASIYLGTTASWSRSWYEVGPLAASSDGDVWTQAYSLMPGTRPSYTLHWNGTIWEELPASLGAPRFITRPGDHFTWEGANIKHRGSVMSPWTSSIEGSTLRLNGIWGTAPDRMWAVGERGTILSRTRTGSWQLQTSPTTEWLSAIWGTAPDQMWAVGYKGTLLSGNGTRFTALLSGTTQTLEVISGSGPKDVWAAGSNILLHWDGNGWTTFSTAIGATAIHALAPNDAWLVNYRTVRRFDGTKWNEVPISLGASEQVLGVWASGASDVWIAGSQDFYHYDGTSLTRVTSGVDQLTGAMWGSGPGDIWARGVKDGEPRNLRWNGTAWSVRDSDTSQEVRSLFGLKGVGVWSAGTGGSILRYTP